MKKIQPVLYFALSFLTVLVSCSADEQEQKKAEPAKISTIAQPFHYQKTIEVKPGLFFDILSWSRGSDTTGSVLILRSDSTHSNFKSTSADLEGKIKDVWNMDMDSDGNPEIFIQSTGKSKGSYFTMYVYEFGNDGSSQQLRFPELTDKTKKSYRGMDSIYVRDGKLRREFPLFKEEDAANKPTDGKKVVEYGIRGNTFTVSEPEEENPANAVKSK